jgi:hypothetical protein
MKSAIAILFLVGSMSSASSAETCTPQSVQYCNQQSIGCFNNSQCRGNPNNCKLRCCLVYPSCLSSRSCDASAYRCSNQNMTLLFTPFLFRLTLHCRRRRVLDLDPMIGAAGAIRRAEPL